MMKAKSAADGNGCSAEDANGCCFKLLLQGGSFLGTIRNLH